MAYTTIDNPADYFNTVLYTGNGSTQSITGVGFQPDWVWVKRRNVDTAHHAIYDSVRGATKQLSSSQTDAETTQSEGLTAFGSDGFTVGNLGRVNEAGGRNYASWNWLAGGTASSNTDGSITSTVSANTTAGFSIVSYTGTTGGASSTIGHGLGVTPDLVILKPRSYVGAWWWAQKGRSDKVLELQATNTEVDPSSSFGGGGLKYSTFTSSVFGGTNGTSNDDLWNTNGATYIAYCFAEKKGFSKLFKYQGNGNTNGTMVHLGFKPAFIICRDPGNLENWFIFDNKRDGINVNKVLLYANDSSGDTTSGANQIDLLSNGFKTRATNNGMNRNGATFIGFAFAENPFVTSGGIPCTAR